MEVGQPHRWKDVINAYADGAIIQSREIGHGVWHDWYPSSAVSPNFNEETLEFRVKPRAAFEVGDKLWTLDIRGMPFVIEYKLNSEKIINLIMANNLFKSKVEAIENRDKFLTRIDDLIKLGVINKKWA